MGNFVKQDAARQNKLRKKLWIVWGIRLYRIFSPQILQPLHFIIIESNSGSTEKRGQIIISTDTRETRDWTLGSGPYLPETRFAGRINFPRYRKLPRFTAQETLPPEHLHPGKSRSDCNR
eukprot:sb/3476156/